MKVAYVVSHYACPARDGKQGQILRLLEALARAGVELSLIALVARDEDANPPPGVALRSFTAIKSVGDYRIQGVLNALGVLPIVGSLVRACTYLGKLRQAVRQAELGADVVLMEGIILAPLLRWVQRVPVIYGAVDSYSMRLRRLSRTAAAAGGLRRTFKQLQVAAAFHLERAGTRRAHMVHVYGARDAEFLRRLHHCAHVTSIPVIYAGRAAADGERTQALLWADASYPYLAVSFENLWRLAGPALLRLYPALSFVALCGDESQLPGAAAMRAAGVEVLGRVEDLNGLLDRTALVVLPDIAGSGIKNRTLHAMSHGCATLGTGIAFESIPARHRHECLRVRSWGQLGGDGGQAWAASPAELATLGRAGANLVQREFGEAEVAGRWLELFGEVAASGVSRQSTA